VVPRLHLFNPLGELPLGEAQNAPYMP